MTTPWTVAQIPDDLGPWMPYICTCAQCINNSSPLVAFEYLKDEDDFTPADGERLRTWANATYPTYAWPPTIERLYDPLDNETILLWYHSQVPPDPDAL